MESDRPAAADEIQTKNKKYDSQRKRLFLPQRKKMALGGVRRGKERNVLPNMSQLLSRQIQLSIRPAYIITNMYRARALRHWASKVGMPASPGYKDFKKQFSSPAQIGKCNSNLLSDYT